MASHKSITSGNTTTPNADIANERCSTGPSTSSDPVLSTPIKYIGPMPITPMAQFDSLDTPELLRQAKKYGMKQTLGKYKLQTKLKEIYHYNHLLRSPMSESGTPTKRADDRLSHPSTLNNVDKVDTRLCLQPDSPTAKNTAGVGGMHRRKKHFAKIIDLTESEGASNQKTSMPEFVEVSESQSRLCSTVDRSHADTAMNAVGDSSEVLILSKIDRYKSSGSETFINSDAEAVEQSCGRISMIPIISLLDSSTDSFVANTSWNHEDKNERGRFISSKCRINTPEECTLIEQSSKKECEFIDLTASDLSDSSVEFLPSDTFKVQASRSSKETACDHVDEHNCTDNTSNEDIVKQTVVASGCNSNLPMDVHSDQNAESSDEEPKIYDEREKFHRSLFGSTHENSTEKEEESDGEYMSLFQRIINKKEERRHGEPSTFTNEIIDVSERDNISITNGEINQTTDRDKSEGRRSTEFSPPQKVRKIQKFDAKKPPSAGTASNIKNQSKFETTKFGKEALELEMCHAIRSNSELHAQILSYRPIYFSRFKLVMKNFGIQVSSNELRDFLDSKGITFSTADENRHKGPRVIKKRRNVK